MRTVVLEDDTVSLMDAINKIITNKDFGYKYKEGDEGRFTDANLIHIALEDLYNELCDLAKKSGIILP
jgi:hypothetical protein